MRSPATRFLLLAMFFLFSQIQCSAKIVSQLDVDQDNEQELVLENKFCKFVIKPSIGAINSFVIKPSGNELLRDSEGGKNRGMLLGDYIEQQGSFGDYMNQPYSFEIIENSDTRAVVKLWRRGTTDLLKWITITKTITVFSDQPEIDVKYQVYNEQASMEDYYLGFCIHNEFDNGQELVFSIPLSNGVLYKTLTPLAKSGTGQNFENITRGWVAISSENGNGIAFNLDYANLKNFYEWHKTSLRSFAISFLTKKIESGGSFETNFTMLPYNMLLQVDGVVKNYAGTIRIDGLLKEGNKTSLQVILSGADVEPVVKISLISPDGKERFLDDIVASKLKDGIYTFKADFIPQQQGLYVVRAIVYQANKIAGEFEKPVKIGEVSQEYSLKPLVPKQKEDKSQVSKTIPRPVISETKKDIPLQEGLPDIELSDRIQTPHINWANPYYLGKTKVFFITHTSREREVIEMAERFSIEYYRVTHGNVGWKVPWKLVSYWTPSLAALHQKKILQQQPLDAILISAPWNSLDPEVQKLILKRVENGTGLVIISPRVSGSIRYGYDYDFVLSEEMKKFPESLASSFVEVPGQWKKLKDHFITTGIPFEVMKSQYSVHAIGENADVLAEVNGKPLIVVGEYGKGRIVALNYNFSDYQLRAMAFLPNLNPFSDYCPSFQWWEYVWSLVIKSTLWSSGREPELLFEKIYSDGKKVVLNLDNQRDGAKFNIDIAVRDEFSNVKLEKSISQFIEKGKNQVVIPLNEISGGGLHFIDVIVKAGNLVVNWGTTTLYLPQVNSIKSVKLEKESYQKTENAKIEISLTKPWSSNQNLNVQVLLYDSRNYLWEKIQVKPQDNSEKVQCEIPLRKIPTMAFYVHVQILDGQDIIDETKIRAIVAQNNEPDDYTYALEVAAGFMSYYQPYWIEELRKHGVNMLKITSISGTSGYCIDSGLKIADTSRIIDTFLLHDKQKIYQELKTQYFKTGDLKYLIRPVCFNDPKYREEVVKRIQLVAGLTKGYGKIDYTLTDELSITHFGDAYDFCFCEHCIKKFRDWVKSQYRDLKELNDAYGTDFKNWDEVRPLTVKEAREKGKWSGWADHRRFNELCLAEFVRWIRGEIRKINPDATISLSGTQVPGPYNGHDVWLRCQVFDNLWAYGSGNQIIMHRSFNPDLKQFPWGGYGSSGPALKHKLWENVLEGGNGNGFWWFPVNLDPDFKLNPCSQAWEEAVADLLNGIGKTIFTSQLENYGVAIHYSQSSIHAAYALDASSTFDANRDAWVEILKRNHICPLFISYEQIEEGQLKYPEIRVLILPYSISLTDKEAEAIRKFVSDGGTVIADIQTGIMDQHCRFRSKGAIDDIFGISRGSFNISPVVEQGNWNKTNIWNFMPDNFPVQLQETGIAVSGGKPLYQAGNIPGIIVNSYGKGKAWYFNFNFSKFETLRKKSQHKILLDFVKEVMARSGVKPYVSVVDEKGEPVDECQVFVYKQGSAYFVGLLPDISFQDGSEKKNGKLIVPSGYRIFDMRNEKPVNPEQIVLVPGIAHFYSLLPYSVEDIETKVPSEVKAGEMMIMSFSLKTAEGLPEDHVIRVDIYNPSGENIYWYSTNLVSSKGKASYRINLPLNALTGTWKIIVKDIPSGVKKVKEFEVKI